MRRTTKVAGVLCVALALTAGKCGDSDGTSFHYCDINTYDAWESYELYLYHDEPRLCPVDLSFKGDYMWTSGTIHDTGTRDFSYSRLQVWNSETTLVEEDEQYFYIDTYNNSVVQHSLSYKAATGYYLEDAIFYQPGGGSFGNPRGQVEVTYTIMR